MNRGLVVLLEKKRTLNPAWRSRYLYHFVRVLTKQFHSSKIELNDVVFYD